MNDQPTPQTRDPQESSSERNDPAIDPQSSGQPGGQSRTEEPQSADPAVDQKNVHDDNDNEFSPGFKPTPDRPAAGEETDADIDTDGG